MSLAVVYTRAELGVNAPLVTVEVHVATGLPGFSIVGLPETVVKESKDRVRSALQNTEFEFPVRRITVNLAPADLPKAGGRFDLPIALGILAATQQIPLDSLSAYEFIGELGLAGELRAIPAVLPAALAARGAGKTLVVPPANAAEAALAKDTKVLAPTHLLELCAHLKNEKTLPFFVPTQIPDSTPAGPCLSDVRDQPHAKRALEIAAAGGHSLLMVGPPGSGKTMLASRLPGLLPTLSEDEALAVAAITSLSTQGFDARTWRVRPFRSPHHTASAPALVGGGSRPKPGEISLAHLGILFLDELPEFDRKVLEVMREPLESGRVTISRASQQMTYPARFQLVAAMNPCPCGYLSDPSGRCHCTAEQVQRYQSRISGPLLDRIDLHLEVPKVPPAVLSMPKKTPAETSSTVQKRILAARAIQNARQGKVNAAITPAELETICELPSSLQKFVTAALERLQLSARAYHRALKVARTIADLAGSETILQEHLAEALSFRKLDRARAPALASSF